MAEEIKLVFQPNPTQLDTVTVDATLTANHSHKADITDHSIDEGGSVVDGIIKKGAELRLDGFISAQRSNGRSTDAYARLKALLGKPITIITALERYENMVMGSLDVRQEKGSGGLVPFSVGFKSVRFAKARSVELVDDPRAKKPGDKGHQPTKPADEPVKNRSILKRGKDSPVAEKAVQGTKKFFAKLGSIGG